MKERVIIFKVEGTVMMGNKKGSELGFPTANIVSTGLIPDGIYAGEAVRKGITYPAAIYKDGSKDIVEAHLLDFSDNLYGEVLTIVAYHKVRDSRTFADEKELISAISKDIEEIKKLCSQE